MPSFHTHGVRAFLQLREPAPTPTITNTSTSASTDTTNTTTAPSLLIAESPPIVKWSPVQGMTHPISTTTILSPAKSSPIPFCIVIEFSPDIPCPVNRRPLPGPNHLKGDVRLEVKIDGVVRGWKVIPQAKIWPKGARIEFSGSRVGRTEERAFIFTPLTLATRRDNQLADTPSPTFAANNRSLPAVSDAEDLTLIPLAPSDLPKNASHIEILITLGKKHNTLEKYLILSPVLQEAFYIPPDPASSPFEGLEDVNFTSNRGTKRKAAPMPRTRKKEVKSSGFLEAPHSPSAPMEEHLGVDAVGANINTMEWKPIGLARESQKTAQMREAEFTARIHLARFWFVIVPGPTSMTTQPRAPTSFNSQQATKQYGILVNNGRQPLRNPRASLDKRSSTNSEDSDTQGGKWTHGSKWEENASGKMKNSGVSAEIGSGTSGQLPETQNNNLYSNVTAEVQYTTTPDRAISSYPGSESSRGTRAFGKGSESVPHVPRSSVKFVGPRGNLSGSTTLNKSGQMTKNPKAGSNFTGSYGNDRQTSEATSRWTFDSASVRNIV